MRESERLCKVCHYHTKYGLPEKEREGGLRGSHTTGRDRTLEVSVLVLQRDLGRLERARTRLSAAARFDEISEEQSRVERSSCGLRVELDSPYALARGRIRHDTLDLNGT